MSAQRFISRKISFKGKAAVTSIAVSFFVMILSLAISSGFRSEIRRSLSEMGGDIRITPPTLNFESADNVMNCTAGYFDEIASLEHVRELRPVIYRTAVVNRDENIQGVLFKGVDMAADSVSMDVKIPRNLARRLGLQMGSDLVAYFVGEKVVARKFKVGGIYDSVTTQDDRMVVFCDIRVLRRVNGWSSDEASAVEIRLTEAGLRHIDDVEQDVSLILFRRAQDDTLMCTRLESSFSQIFDWLHLVDNNVVFILIIMTIVAGFNMITGLLILLFENISTIGLLKSMGMTNGNIAGTFVRTSSSLVGKGLAIGNIAAIALCLLQKYTHLMSLNPENYFLDFLPVELDLPFILLCDLGAFAAIILLLLLPCAFISGVDPATTMRQK